MNFIKNALPPEFKHFIIVGTCAAAAHFSLVLILVQWLGLHPLLANIIAFLISFNVSYCGHRFWTFSDTELTHTQSMPRFFLVSSSSFALNEAMYYVLLKYTAMPYWLSLAVVLVLVAAVTFISSRLWAFRKNG